MSSLRDAIDAAKARLPLPQLLARLDLERHARRSARCPLHEDHSPSFSVFLGTHGWRWKCHAGCGEGDEIDFLEAHFRISRAEAVQCFCALAGEMVGGFGSGRTGGETSNISLVKLGPASPQHPTSNIQWVGSNAASGIRIHPAAHEDHFSHDDHRDALRTGPQLPEDARPPNEDECRELAALRRIHELAPRTASRLGTLLIGTVCGQRCWIITDERGLCAEARRMDGLKFPALGHLGERKAHTLRGSVKNWPVGLALRDIDLNVFRAVLAVEGGPDYLAALHFAILAIDECLPIAFLGAGTARELHPAAGPLLRGRRVRFYPHHEASGAGRRAAHRWCQQLTALGCTCDAVDFSTLPCLDGEPIKDLNDCTRLEAGHAHELKGLLP